MAGRQAFRPGALQPRVIRGDLDPVWDGSEGCARGYEAVSPADLVSVGASSELPSHVGDGVGQDVLKSMPRSPTSQRLDLRDVRHAAAHVLKSLLVRLVVGHQLDLGARARLLHDGLGQFEDGDLLGRSDVEYRAHGPSVVEYA